MHPFPQSRTGKILSAAFPYTEQQSAEARPYRSKHFQYRSSYHRLSRGWQQSEQAERQQKVKPVVGAGNGSPRPEAT